MDRTIADRIEQASTTITARANELGQTFDQADQTLNSRIGSAANMLSTRAAEFGNAFEVAERRIASQIEASADQLNSRVGDVVGAFENIDRQLAERTNLTSAEMADRARSIEDALHNLENRLADSANSVITNVESQVDAVERRLAEGAEVVGQKLVDQVAVSEAQLASRANVIAETFAAVNTHIGQRTNEAAASFDKHTRDLNDMLAARTAEIGRVLDEQARPLVARFAESGGELQQNLEAATHAASERLRSENAALVNALASRTAETLSAVEGARVSLSDSVDELLKRLTASSSSLGQLINVAQSNLGDLEDRLAGTTQSFAATTEKSAQTFASSARIIDVNATRLTELSSKTLKDIASIAHRFDDHSRVLNSASDLLGSAQSNLASTLDERQAALETLAVNLVKKSDDIEGVMRAFEELIGKTFEKADGRTRQATENMRSAISEVVEGATQRFADATQEIRRTASLIRTELDETRSELRKGVLDLPEETKETTTAMRRAVSEQINALKELSDIVARSGRSASDQTGQPRRPAPAPAPRQAAPQAPQRAVAPPPAPEPIVEARPAPAPAPRQATPAAKQRTPVETPAQTGGWVSDLLRRASDETPARAAPVQPAPTQRSPLHVVESLNSLSVDIARAIDHDASIELWDRYRRGERNVFTRRLYTLKGQQTFDDIRRKYQTEPDFRSAVDRYCDDFEKLIADVTRNDRDSMMAQTYLSSDTGKVYTMLAHASGRLK